MSDAPETTAAASADAGTSAPQVTTAASTLIDTADQGAPQQDTQAQADQQQGGEQQTEGEAEAIKIPGKDATREEWAEFYAKIGRPETPEGYELPVPEGDDGAFAKQMAPILHKHGITAEQAKGLAEDWNALVAQQRAEFEKAEAERIKALDTRNKAEATELRNEWGQKHDENMEFARRAVRQFLPKEKAQDVISAIEGALGYKETIKFLHSIGQGLAEADAAGLNADKALGRKSLAERLYGSAE